MNTPRESPSVDGTIARVTSAVALTGEEKTAVAQKLRSVIGHDVTVESIVDPEVLGGMKIEVGEWVIDATVIHQLESLARSLKE